VEKKYPDEMVDGFLDTVMLASELGAHLAQHGKAVEVFQELLAKQQLEDGSWLRRDGHNEPGFSIIPPALKDDDSAKREAREVDTMWALLGLNALSRIGNPLSPSASGLLTKQQSS